MKEMLPQASFALSLFLKDKAGFLLQFKHEFTSNIIVFWATGYVQEVNEKMTEFLSSADSLNSSLP